MTILSKLSIVIISYNRQNFILRQLEYWKDIPVSIIVIDGSFLSLKKEVLNNRYTNLNYIHSSTSFAERIGIAAKISKKDYTIFLGDDEFYSISALEKCLYFLEQNPDYVSCMGQCLAFKVKENKILGWPIYEEFFEHKNDSDSNFDRIYYHMSNYTCASIYSVIRTNVWDTVFSLIPKSNCDVFAIEEYQIELGINFIGKTKVLDELLWFRSFELNSHAHNKKLKFFTEWWSSNYIIKEKNLFINNISHALSTYTKINEIEVINGVKRALDLFYKWNIQFAPQPSFIKSPYFYIGQNLPQFIKNMIIIFKPIYTLFRPKIKNKLQIYDIDEVLIKLKNKGYKINFNDVLKIKNSISNHHNIII
jgi:glycosyltransferase domain-containing protein